MDCIVKLADICDWQTPIEIRCSGVQCSNLVVFITVWQKQKQNNWHSHTLNHRRIACKVIRNASAALYEHRALCVCVFVCMLLIWFTKGEKEEEEVEEGSYDFYAKKNYDMWSACISLNLN